MGNGNLTIIVLMNGLVLSLVAVAFAYIYRATQNFFFAMAAIIVLAPYIYIYLLDSGVPMIAALLVSLLVTSCFSFFMERASHSRFAGQKNEDRLHLICSLGYYFVMISLISLAWGSDHMSITFLEESVSNIVVVSSTSFLLLLCLIFSTTRMGVFVKILDENPSALSLLGIDPKMVRTGIFLTAGFLAGAAGLLDAVRNGTFHYSNGLTLFLPAVAAMVIANSISVIRLVFASILISAAQTLAIYFFGAEWKTAISFLLAAFALTINSMGQSAIGRSRLDAA